MSMLKMKQHPCKKNIDQYRETKRRLQKESRKAYWQYLENIICYDESIETVQKQKQFWNYIRNTKKDSSGVAPLRSDGLLVDDTKDKAEILNRQYFSVFTPEDTDEQLPPLNDNFQSMPEIKATILGTEKLLKNLDPTKATGPDQIPARILKQFAAEFAP
jgi:hypothetical protein